MPEPKRVTHARSTSWEITYRVEGRQVRRRFPTKTAAGLPARPGRRAVLSTGGKLWAPPRPQRVHLEAQPAPRRPGRGPRLPRLRHTYASGPIAQNIHPEVIQARLGHASITETMDTYGHLFPDSDEITSTALDEIFGPAAAAAHDPRGPVPGARLRVVE